MKKSTSVLSKIVLLEEIELEFVEGRDKIAHKDPFKKAWISYIETKNSEQVVALNAIVKKEKILRKKQLIKSFDKRFSNAVRNSKIESITNCYLNCSTV